MSRGYMEPHEDKKDHIVMVGVDPPSDDYDDQRFDVIGPMTMADAFNFAQECSDIFEDAELKLGDAAHPYGFPVARVCRVTTATSTDAARKWIKEDDDH